MIPASHYSRFTDQKKMFSTVFKEAVGGWHAFGRREPPKHCVSRKALLLLPVVLLSATLSIAAQVDENTSPRKVLRSEEFAENPNLVAGPQQSVLLDNNLPAGPDEPAVRYGLQSGSHFFCLSGSDPYYTGLVLKDGAGTVIFTMPRGQHCRQAELAEGTYTVQISHSNAVPDSQLLTFVGVDEPGPPLHDANGNPLGGYWAITPLGTQLVGGVLRPLPPPRNLGGIYTSDMPIIADFSAYRWDETSLFSFPAKGHPVPLGAPGFFLDMLYETSIDTDWVLVSGNHNCNLRPDTCDYFAQIPNTFYHQKLQINDLGHSQFTFTWPAGPDTLYFTSQSTPFNPNTMRGLLKNPGSPQPTKMWLQYRYYPDGSQLGTLNQGEVGFFEKCNYQGHAAVATNSFDPDSYSIDGYPSYKNQYFSVRLSNNTTVQLSTITAPGGTPSQSYFIANDAACLPAQLFDANLIVPIDSFLLDGRGNTSWGCPNCRLVNTNLSNFNLQGSNWQQADMTGANLTNVGFSGGTNLSGAKLINATLSSVNFEGSTLTGADFAGAKLTCVDFSGTSQNPRDLTQLTWTNVQWISSSSCRSNLSYTRLSTAILPPALWKDANLTGAVFVDLKPGMQLSSEKNPLDLTGAELGGVSLEQVVLDYAALTGADLTQTIFSNTSLRHVNLSGAKLFGAQLNGVNLDGANMSGAYLTKPPSQAAAPAATLTGAFLRNVNLSKAQLSGADFTDASFYGTTAAGTGTCAPDSNTGFTNGCATAEGATMNNTQFANAYLFGVDFTGAVAQGVRFANAFLAGANFAKARLSADVSGTNSGFAAAFLQGANLANVMLQNRLSLENAFVDFSGSNAIYLVLNGDHTTFAGYWNTPGQSVCAEMFYTSSTFVPKTDSTVTCPDGNSYPNGCGNPFLTDGTTPNPHWKSRVDISQYASYQFDSTFTPAPKSGTPICQPDQNWIKAAQQAASTSK